MVDYLVECIQFKTNLTKGHTLQHSLHFTKISSVKIRDFLKIDKYMRREKRFNCEARLYNFTTCFVSSSVSTTLKTQTSKFLQNEIQDENDVISL